LAVLEATGEPAADARHETRHLHRVRLPQAFVTASVDGEPVGIGRAVADDGWTGVYSMATAPRARRSGVARAVLGAIAGWAQTQGAPRLYLQVEQSNDAARRLYASAGFTPLAAYHYRFQRSSAGRAA
jgi:GNAT superfamily N-acetyltransferase